MNSSHWQKLEMKPKYSCPECPQQFSRKWNMREHCRTQHNYDPEPNPHPLPEVQRKITATSEITTSPSVERFLKMMSTSVRFQKTGVSSGVLEVFANSWGSIENAVDYLLDNFVIVNKREIQGISAFFCNKCLEFEYRYIRNIVEDNTAEDLHVHTSHMLSVVNKSKENELRNQAYKVLVELTDSLLPDAKKFMHLERPLEKFRGPVIKVDS